MLKHFVSKQAIVQTKVRVRAVDAGVCPLKGDEFSAGPQAERLPRGDVFKHDAAPRPAAYVVRPLNERGAFLISGLHVNQADFLDRGVLFPRWVGEGKELLVHILVGAAVLAVDEDPVAVG